MKTIIITNKLLLSLLLLSTTTSCGGEEATTTNLIIGLNYQGTNYFKRTEKVTLTQYGEKDYYYLPYGTYCDILKVIDETNGETTSYCHPTIINVEATLSYTYEEVGNATAAREIITCSVPNYLNPDYATTKLNRTFTFSSSVARAAKNGKITKEFYGEVVLYYAN